MFFSCKPQVSKTDVVKKRIEKQEEKFKIDSNFVSEKLLVNIPNCSIKTKDRNILVPFNYSLNYSNGSYSFKWNLCNLKIDSDSTNYSYCSFEDNVPYKGYIGFEGKLHFVKTIDSTAVTLEKFKKLHSENYKQIYYSDNESIIFKTQRDAVAVLHFKYLKEEKVFSIFFKENKELGFKANEEELVDLAITQLRASKNFHSEKKVSDLQDWNNFKKSLSILNKKVFKVIYSDIVKSINTLGVDKVYTAKIDGSWNLISIINAGEETRKLWDAINKIQKIKKIDFQNIYNTKLSDQISYLRSYENFIQLEYKDDSTIILSKEYKYSKDKQYAVFGKKIVNNKEVLMFTGGRGNQGKVNSKEMAYFYLNLFKNFNEI